MQLWQELADPVSTMVPLAKGKPSSHHVHACHLVDYPTYFPLSHPRETFLCSAQYVVTKIICTIGFKGLLINGEVSS